MTIHSKDRTPSGTMIIPSKSTLTVQAAESEKGAYIGSSEPYSTNEGDMIPYLSHPANQTSTGSGALKDLNLRLSDTGSVLKEADFIWKFDDDAADQYRGANDERYFYNGQQPLDDSIKSSGYPNAGRFPVTVYSCKANNRLYIARPIDGVNVQLSYRDLDATNDPSAWTTTTIQLSTAGDLEGAILRVNFPSDTNNFPMYGFDVFELPDGSLRAIGATLPRKQDGYDAVGMVDFSIWGSSDGLNWSLLDKNIYRKWAGQWITTPYFWSKAAVSGDYIRLCFVSSLLGTSGSYELRTLVSTDRGATWSSLTSLVYESSLGFCPVGEDRDPDYASKLSDCFALTGTGHSDGSFVLFAGNKTGTAISQKYVSLYTAAGVSSWGSYSSHVAHLSNDVTGRAIQRMTAYTTESYIYLWMWLRIPDASGELILNDGAGASYTGTWHDKSQIQAIRFRKDSYTQGEAVSRYEFAGSSQYAWQPSSTYTTPHGLNSILGTGGFSLLEPVRISAHHAGGSLHMAFNLVDPYNPTVGSGSGASVSEGSELNEYVLIENQGWSRKPINKDIPREKMPNFAVLSPNPITIGERLFERAWFSHFCKAPNFTNYWIRNGSATEDWKPHEYAIENTSNTGNLFFEGIENTTNMTDFSSRFGILAGVTLRLDSTSNYTAGAASGNFGGVGFLVGFQDQNLPTPIKASVRVLCYPSNKISVSDNYTSPEVQTHYTDGVDFSKHMKIRVTLVLDGVNVYAQLWWAKQGEPDGWKTSGRFQITKETSAVGSNPAFLNWGHFNNWGFSGSAKMKSYWQEAFLSVNSTLQHYNKTNPDGIIGRLCSPFETYVSRSVSARWGGGSGFEDDQFNAKVEHQYGAKNLLQPSPSVVYRSDDITHQNLSTEKQVTLQADEIVFDSIALFNCNVRTVKFDFASSLAGLASSSLGAPHTIDFSIGSVLTVGGLSINHSPSMTLSPQGSDQWYWRDGQLAGHFVSIYQNGTMNLITTFKIEKNVGSLITVTGHTQGIYQYGVRDDDIAYLYAPTGVSLGLSAAAPNRARFIRLFIPAQPVPNNGSQNKFFQLGAINIGTRLDLSLPLEWRMSDTEEPNIEKTTVSSGLTVTHKLGKPRRKLDCRLVGDVGNYKQRSNSTSTQNFTGFRNMFRDMISTLCDYGMKPITLILDEKAVGGTDPYTSAKGKLTRSETVFYCRFTGATQLDQEAWYYDEDGVLRQLGDLGLVFEEEI